MFHCGVKVKKRWENLADPTEPHKVPGVLQHQWPLWLLSPALPVRQWGLLMLERGPGRQSKGCKGIFTALPHPGLWLTQQELQHLITTCTGSSGALSPSLSPSQVATGCNSPKPRSHGGRVLLMKAKGCDFPVGIQLKKGP